MAIIQTVSPCEGDWVATETTGCGTPAAPTATVPPVTVGIVTGNDGIVGVPVTVPPLIDDVMVPLTGPVNVWLGPNVVSAVAPGL